MNTIKIISGKYEGATAELIGTDIDVYGSSVLTIVCDEGKDYFYRMLTDPENVPFCEGTVYIVTIGEKRVALNESEIEFVMAPAPPGMIVPYPQFCPTASIAFTIIGKIMQRCPSDLYLGFRMTFPCGGQYQCLSLFTDFYQKHVCDFNLHSGNLHIHSPVEASDCSGIERWPEPRNYLLAFLSQEHGLDRVVNDTLAAMGIKNPEASNLYRGCTALTLGSLLSRFMFDREQIGVENGWANGENEHAKWLELAPEDCVTKPYADSLAANIWHLQCGDNTVMLDDELAYLLGTDEVVDLCSAIQKNGGSCFLACNRLEAHLRGA